jgi:hypothetical protein
VAENNSHNDEMAIVLFEWEEQFKDPEARELNSEWWAIWQREGDL